MAKTKTIYVCSECNHQSYGWTGKCDSCSAWHTMVEQVVAKSVASGTSKYLPATANGVQRAFAVSKLHDAVALDSKRMSTQMDEFDRVLGGGFVTGSIVLLGGQPGIGKSTISLQLLNNLSKLKCLYVAGEETTSQIATRAERLGSKLDHVDFLECNYLEEIVKILDKENPQFLIVDSIQVIRSLERDLSPNSQSLITYICDTLTEVVKRKNITCILIGHVTKEGEIAGPKILEHLVDVVLYFQGDRDGQYRFLKSLKNRFGSTHEVGLFKMESAGLNQINDPTKEFVSIRDKEVSGVALSCIMEGARPIIVEIQALCVKTSFGYAKRSCVGFDMNRLNMILAVLQKFYSVDLSEQDVYVNVTGGLKIKDTACDLAVMHALKASYFKQSHKMDTVYIGEVGLTGEIKKASFSDARKAECERLGFGVSKKV